MDFVYFSSIVVDMKRGGSASTAESIRGTVLGVRERFFRAEDFPGPRTAVARALSRLADEGQLRRVRRGLYWRGLETPLGMAPPTPEAVLRAVYRDAPGLGPARLDAARALGLSTQVTRRPTFAVPYDVDGLGPLLVNRSRRTGRGRSRLTDVEVALLEVLDDWDEVVELPLHDAVGRLRSLLGEAIRPDAVADAAETEPARVRERLRALLAAAGRSDAARRVPPAAHEETRDAALRRFPAAA